MQERRPDETTHRPGFAYLVVRVTARIRLIAYLDQQITPDEEVPDSLFPSPLPLLSESVRAGI